MRTPRRLPARPHRLTAAALAATLALGACSGGDGGGAGKVALTKSGNLDAAATARLLREGGAIRTGGEASRAGASAPVRARISYRPARAVYRFPILAEGKAYRIQVRRIGEEAWLQRAPASAGAAGAPAVAVTPRGQRRWVALPAEPLEASGILTAYNPALTLDGLARARVPLRRTGRERVRGRDSVRFLARASERTGLLPGGAERFEVWISTVDGRPTRLRYRLPDGLISYDVASAPEPQVAAPAPDRIQPPAPGARPEPAGAFTEVVAGSAAGVTYRVSVAEGTQGTTCWKVESTPPFRSSATMPASGAVCVVPPQRDGELDERVVFPIDAGPEAGFEMLGVLVPPGAELELHFTDGSRRILPLTDSARGFALYVGAPDPAPGFLTVRLAAETAGCAPGDITEASELAGLDASGVEALRRYPWACLPG
jgi:hypothetical protein